METLGILLISSIAFFYLPSHSIIMKSDVFDNKQKVSLNYYIRHIAIRDPERVKVEGGLIIVESLKNL